MEELLVPSARETPLIPSKAARPLLDRPTFHIGRADAGCPNTADCHMDLASHPSLSGWSDGQPRGCRLAVGRMVQIRYVDRVLAFPHRGSLCHDPFPTNGHAATNETRQVKNE